MHSVRRRQGVGGEGGSREVVEYIDIESGTARTVPKIIYFNIIFLLRALYL